MSAASVVVLPPPGPAATSTSPPPGATSSRAPAGSPRLSSAGTSGGMRRMAIEMPPRCCEMWTRCRAPLAVASDVVTSPTRSRMSRRRSLSSDIARLWRKSRASAGMSSAGPGS